MWSEITPPAEEIDTPQTGTFDVKNTNAKFLSPCSRAKNSRFIFPLVFFLGGAGARQHYGALLETDPDLHLSRTLQQDAAP